MQRRADHRDLEGQGAMPVNALYRKHDIRDVSLYMWPNEHGGMHGSKARRLRQLGALNSRLKLIMVVDDFMKELVTAEARS